jgi:putative ABC transport system permease protein
MTRMALRGLIARKLRTALTGFAVVIGVAFVAGTFIFTDTINSSFTDLFERVTRGTDVSVTANQPVSGDFGGRTMLLPESTLEKVRAVPGVAAAAGNLSTNVSLFKDGKRIGGNGAPPLINSSTLKRFDPLTYEEGHAATKPGEVTLDAATAERHGYHLGDPIEIAGRAPAARYTLVGITKLGDQKSIGLASMTMPLSEVQRISQQPGGISDISVAAAGGDSPAQLKAAIKQALGASATVRTGKEEAAKRTGDITDSLGFLKTGLLIFAGVAVLVGGFLIFNTFAVTVAQRSREFALLRTLGASRRQILNSVVLETLIIGVLASIVGILGGLVIAPALRGLLSSFGIDFPGTSTVVASRTIIVGLLVGVIATMISGFVPARRATQVQPVEAMREAATPGGRPVGVRRVAGASVTIAVGLAVLLLGLFVASGGGAGALIGLGLIGMMFGVALLAPVLVKPLARIIGAPLQRFQGMTGRLAQENAERQPQRTAITASALMIGLALVVFTAIFAAGLRGSIDKVVDEQFGRTALVVTHEDGFTPVPAAIGERLGRLPGVQDVSPLRFDQANVRGVDTNVPASGVDPATITTVFKPEWKQGSDATLRDLTNRQALADSGWASDHGLRVGDTLDVTTPAAKRVRYEITGLYENKAGALGQFIVTNASMTADWKQPDDALVLVRAPGDPDRLEAQAEALLEAFPTAKVQTLAQFKDTQADQINQLLGLVFALLALSVIVALLGIVNTLALAVHERTRELGLLRAVGMSRRQVRRMVRAESVITALIGAILGLVLGAIFAVVVSRPLASDGFVLKFPWVTLIAVTVAAAVAGVLAAVPPARRAARVDVLRAVTAE